MRKIIRVIFTLIFSGLIVLAVYLADMKIAMIEFSKERLNTINYQTLASDFEEMMVFDAVKERLGGKTLEDYIISQCHMTENMRRYFKSKDTSKPEYYASVRDIEMQLLTTIDELCVFLNEQDELHPRIYIKQEKEEK